MAYWNIKNVAIKGIAACVPDNKISTYDLDLFTKEEATTFIKTVGIENRYWAPDGICASDLCFSAAEKLIKELNWNKEDIEILAFESVTPDYKTPPTSTVLQDRLGLSNNCFALDIPMGCCGFLYGMNVVSNLIASGTAKRGLLLVGDTATRMGSQQDKSRVPLFGDCGTAIALEYDENVESIRTRFYSDGSGYKALFTPHGGYRHPAVPESFIYEDFGNGIKRAPIHATIDGLEVFSFAITKAPLSINQFLEDHQIDRSQDVDYFLIHQANKMINDRVIKKIQIDKSKTTSTLRDFGNTGGASIPLTMVANLRDELQNNKLSLVMSSFGLGLTWGVMHINVNKIVVPELIKL